VASLLVVQTVMNGFGEEHRLRIRESFGDVVALSAGMVEQPDALAARLIADPAVRSAVPDAEGLALVGSGDFSSVAFVRGVLASDPDLPARRYVVDGSLDQLDDGRVVLGRGLARQLRVGVGDRIELWAPAMAARAERGRAPFPAELEVCAILRTGFTEVDDRAALVPLRRFRELWDLGDRAHGLTLRLHDPSGPAAEAAAARLESAHAGIRFRPWTLIKRDFLEAIRFEKTMLFFLMFIITLVASFSIGSSLFSAVIRRSREIGVLAALGAGPSAIAAVFAIQGLLIGLLGTLLGFVLTWGILAGRESILSAINALFGDGDLVGQVYQFGFVPLHYDAADFALAAVFTLLTTAVAGLVPALWAARRRPTEAMRDA
jgi:lipoprotein-releasing system permease protein